MAGNLRAFLAEIIGTFAWVFFAAGAVCADALMGGRLGPTGVALAQGLGVALAFGIFGRHSPGLFNPAFTAALAAVRCLDWAKAALSLVCQLLGAALAGLLLAQIFSHTAIAANPPHLGAPVPSQLVGFRGATLIEAVLTFFMALTAYGAWEEKEPVNILLRAGLIGGAATAASLVGGPLSGAILNPARAFGPAVASGYWTQHYVFWVGPTAGAVLGIGLLHSVFKR